MASNLFKLLFLFILVNFLSFPTTEAEAEEIIYFGPKCSDDRTTFNSTYQENLMAVFSSLSSKATDNTFYNNTVASRDASDAVYGLFMCRGDVPSQVCRQCVLSANHILSAECALSKSAIIWYEECMVRYSNSSFFSIMETQPFVSMTNRFNITNQANFIPLLGNTMNKTADEAAFSLTGDKYYATKEAEVSELQTVFCLSQCTQDLSPQDCRACLRTAVAELPKCCKGKRGGRVLLPSCNVRYELYPFYRVSAPKALVPATKYSETDSKYSQDPGYLHHNCSSDRTTTFDDGFKQNLTALLSHLSSNATGSGYNDFHMTSVANAVFGLYLCRADLPPYLCGQCVVNATHRIASECPTSVEAVVWYNHCLLRYSNQSFFHVMSTSPRFAMLNITNVIDYESSYKYQLWSPLFKVAGEIGDNNDRYWTESFVLNHNQTLYILAQCTKDLNTGDCGYCIHDVVETGIPWSRLGSVGGRVLYPSCTMRFELFPFYRNGTEDQPPSPPPTTEKNGRSRVIVLIVVPIVASMILFSFVCYLLRRRARKRDKAILKENFGHESTTVESLQFDLPIIEAATKKFSHENRIGKGGFGEVYKGVLPDGRHIAVKRLSRCSTQGVAEFKNEILLIAKLQHKNLVAFIGFCLEEQEKILIYEYVLNKSLDYFLFDPHSEKLLTWSERYKIMEGIALGILYLHEYSRLKVIHRDLKPSNILLDENMNPKISDFGLARILDQQQGSTNRVVGTLGYLSPEYAMQGQFSEKSDIFSFGVMVLEIITGKKNVGTNEPRYSADGLLSSVWRQFWSQTPLCILDPKIKENCSKFEVIRFIQIGLLCVQENPNDRPTMMTVVSYINNHLIELPSPREPAFFLHGKMDQKIVLGESSSSSINEMSISNSVPR